MVDAFLQRALRVRECLGRTAKLHAPADVVAADVAVLAALAGQADLEGHAVAGRQVLHGAANGDDGAAGLVAEGEGLADDDVAVAVVVKVVQVGAAETGGLNGDLDLIGSGTGQIAPFLRLQCEFVVMKYWLFCSENMRCVTYNTKIASTVQDGSLDFLGRHGVLCTLCKLLNFARLRNETVKEDEILKLSLRVSKEVKGR